MSDRQPGVTVEPALWYRVVTRLRGQIVDRSVAKPSRAERDIGCVQIAERRIAAVTPLLTERADHER